VSVSAPHRRLERDREDGSSPVRRPGATSRSRVEDFVQSSIHSWIALFQTLIAERSVYEAEHGAVDVIARRLAAGGVATTRVEHRRDLLELLPAARQPFSPVPDRASLVARVPGCGGGRSLALSAHLDIVPEGDPSRWTHPPF